MAGSAVTTGGAGSTKVWAVPTRDAISSARRRIDRKVAILSLSCSLVQLEDKGVFDVW
jgi:hypothetical protein